MESVLDNTATNRERLAMGLYDYIIVGSGASGAVAGYYLAASGARCLLLEAGRAYTAADFPLSEFYANTHLFWNGGMDLSADAEFAFLRGKALGGGTIVNQCLLDRFDETVFDEWRSISNVGLFVLNKMLPHYEAIEKHLSIQDVPQKAWNKNASIFVRGLEKAGLKWAPVRRGQSNCPPNHDCMICLGGCPRNSKQSMLVSFLPKAKQLGLEVLTDCKADELIYGKDQVALVAQYKNRKAVFYARHIVLAAGALGTTELLFKSGFDEHFPALGSGFYCHPQYMAIAFFEDPIDAHRGSFQGVKSEDPFLKKEGYKLENVFTGPIAVGMLMPGFGWSHQRMMEKYRNMACMEVAVRDVQGGTIRLGKHKNLVIEKPSTGEDSNRAKRGLSLVQEIFASNGAQSIHASSFKFGLHLMGGCPIGEHPGSSVVNSRFQVHGFPRLQIVDASIFPFSSGINPSLSIMAISHAASQILLEAEGVKAAPVREPMAQQEAAVV